MPLQILGQRLLDYANPINWDAPLNRGLAGWWLHLPQRRGGMRWLDLVGSTPARLLGGVSWSPQAPPGGWGSLLLDGSNDYLDTRNVNLAGLSSLTVTLWVKNALATISSTQQGLVYKTSATFDFMLQSNTTQVYIQNNVAWHQAVVSPAYTDWNIWHHLAMVYDGAFVRLYRDGLLSATSGSETGAFGTDNAPFYFGWSSTGGANYLNGRLADIRYYTRSLAAREITALYQASRRRYPTELRWRSPLHLVPLALSVPTVVHSLTAALSGVSVTPPSAEASQRHLTGALLGTSTTPSSARLLTRRLSSALVGASTTPTSQAQQTHRLTSALLGASTTPATLGQQTHRLSAGLSAGSTTASSAATQQRRLTAGLVGASTTPGAARTTVRRLMTTLASSTLTPLATAVLTALRALQASVLGASTTPASGQLLLHRLHGLLISTTQTPAALSQVLRPLAAILPVASATPPAVSQLGRNLRTSLEGLSQTSLSARQLVRWLMAQLVGATVTPPSRSQGDRPLQAALLGISVTPAAVGSPFPEPATLPFTPGRLRRASQAQAGALTPMTTFQGPLQPLVARSQAQAGALTPMTTAHAGRLVQAARATSLGLSRDAPEKETS